MTTGLIFKACGYDGDTELPAIADLINTCQAADNLEDRPTVTQLREDFADPTFDVAQDLQLWRNVDNELVAAAELWQQLPGQELIGRLMFVIHPQVRGSTIANDILAWAEKRLLTIGQETLMPIVLHSGCRDTIKERRSLLTQWGFRPERVFWRLQRSLEDPIAKSSFSPSWRIRSVTPQDAENWVEMFNQTFVDHWNHSPTTVDEFRHYIACSNYNANLDLVIEAADRQMVAFCCSEIDTERNDRLGIQEGHIDLLGTCRGYRRQGLARALLVESLYRLRLLGMATATIGVDSQNPSGAVRLYESVGFEQDQCSTVFQKVIRPSLP